MRVYQITISFFGARVASENLERIRSTVSRNADHVELHVSKIIVQTYHPGAFITRFYDEGFEEGLSCVVL